jgi:hypothetical protein
MKMKPEKVAPASEVFDNGRRGEPLISCDCFQCFGYCITDSGLIDREARMRQSALPEGESRT